MQIDRRITNGLAWAGAFLVVGIPAADLVSAQLAPGGGAAPTAQIAVVETPTPMPAPLAQRPAAKPAEATVAALPAPVVSKPAAAPAVVEPAFKEVAATPAAVPEKPAPAAPARAQTANAVDAFVQSGKPLPGYITDGSKPATAPQQAIVTPAPAVPAKPVVVEPQAIDPVEVAALPTKVAPTPMPLSMRPTPIQVPIVAAVPTRDDLILPPAEVVRPAPEFSSRDLEDWESGPLSEFLAQRQAGSSATVVYEDEGFFVDSVSPRDRYIGPADSFFAPPGY
jgi:hypothetical protein